MTIGERIKILRKEKKLSMEDFGAVIGVGKSAVSRIENGVNGTTDQTIRSICREFGVNEHWLRTGEGEMFEQTKETALDHLAFEYGLNSSQRAVIEGFLDLTPSKKNGIFIGDHIKALRKALRLTQQEFAARIGSVQNTITGYETGRRSPSGQVISLICKEFGASESWLRTGEGEMFSHQTPIDKLAQDLRLGPCVKQLLAVYLQLSEADKQAVERFAIQFARSIQLPADPPEEAN